MRRIARRTRIRRCRVAGGALTDPFLCDLAPRRHPRASPVDAQVAAPPAATRSLSSTPLLRATGDEDPELATRPQSACIGPVSPRTRCVPSDPLYRPDSCGGQRNVMSLMSRLTLCTHLPPRCAIGMRDPASARCRRFRMSAPHPRGSAAAAESMDEARSPGTATRSVRSVRSGTFKFRCSA